MSWITYFLQECPSCGRKLQIRVAHMGRNVACQHCQKTFLATDPANAPADDLTESTLLQRADQLLESVSIRHKSNPAANSN